MSNDWNWTVDLGSAQGVGQRSPAPRPKEYPHDAGFLSDSVEAFRTARSGEYCIWIVSPPGYSHSRCFEEVALSFQAAFLELGYRVPVVSDPALVQGRAIVLGPHLLPHIPAPSLRDRMILFNLEQVSESSSWMTEEYRGLLKEHCVWDYSKNNIRTLADMGITGVTLCPIGYSPALSRIEPASNPDIDVLFIGSLNKRRRQVLNGLIAKGIDARWGFNIYGRERDAALSRAKLILNMHMYDAKVFEIVRVSYLLANRMCVVSETGSDPELESRFCPGVAFTDIGEIPEVCESLLKDQVARQRLKDEGFRIFSSMTQREFLQSALEHSGIG